MHFGNGMLILIVSAYFRADPEAEQILERAIAAQGGKDKLVQFQRFHMRSNGRILGDNLVMEQWIDLPARRKQILHFEKNGKSYEVIQVVTKDEMWQKVNDTQARRATEQELKDEEEFTYRGLIRLLFPILQDKQRFRVENRGEMQLESKMLRCVRVKADKQPDMDLFFDKESGLLTGLSYKAIYSSLRGKTITATFGDYRELGGLKYPRTLKTSIDSQPFSQYEVTDLRLIETFPPGTFKKP